MAERKYFPEFPVRRKLQPAATNPGAGSRVDNHLADLQSAHGGALRAWHEWQDDRARVDKQLADGILGPKGHAEAVAALAKDFTVRLSKETGQWLKRPKSRVDELRTRPVAMALKPDAPESDKIDASHLHNRIIERFERLSPAARRTAIRAALDTGDERVLKPLLREYELTGAMLDSASALHPYHVVNLLGPNGATGTCYVEVRMIRDGRKWSLSGWYDDEYAKVDGEWRFKSRRINVDSFAPSSEG